MTASTWTTTPSSRPEQRGLAERGGELDLVRPRARHRLGARPTSVSGCTWTLRAPSAAASRTTNSRLSALYWVSVKMKPNGVPDERTTSRLAIVWAKAPARRRISSCSSGVPSIEIASTSTSPASGSQRLGVRSMPFEVTVVTIPSARARASRAGNGR